MHKESNHGIKQTFHNLILGFEFDIERHTEILQTMEEEVDTIKCGQCEFKSCSEGKPVMHEQNIHSNLGQPNQG